jgi:hypothetical protein
MKKIIFYQMLITAFLLGAETVPKEASLGITGDYSIVEQFNRSALGIGISTRYGWQVGGLGTDYPHYLDIPMMLSFVPSQSPDKPDSFLMRYGWSTRHYLTPRKTGGFYLSYGLFLNQVWEWDKSGRILGHETLLSAGYDLPSEGPLQLVCPI